MMKIHHRYPSSMSGGAHVERNSHVNQAFVSECQDDSDGDSSYTESDGASTGSDKSYGPVSSGRFQDRSNNYHGKLGNGDYYRQPNQTNGSRDSDKSFSSERLKTRLSNRVKKWISKQKVVNGCSDSHEDNKDKNSNVVEDHPPSTQFTVVLHVDPKRHNYGRRATPCEVLFGIITEKVPQQTDLMLQKNRNSIDKRVVIKGFIPNGEAIKCGKLKIGDWLDKVDDANVTIDNINEILSTITAAKQVKLTVQRPEDPKLITGRKEWFKSNMRFSFVKQITCDKNTLEEISIKHKKIPHAVMYLSTEATDKEGVLYQYPSFSNCITTLKGMFLTLSHVIRDVTSRPPRSSSLVIEDQLIHVSYSMEGGEVLVLALPSSCVSQQSVAQMIFDLTRLLKFQYLSLSKSFGDASNKPSLDHFFLLYFDHYLGPSYKGSSEAVIHVEDLTLSIQRLPIQLNLEEQVEKLVSGFESLCDAGCDGLPDAEDNFKGAFVMLGLCLFYKGYLICNHLLKDHLLDVYLYLRHYQLLQFTRKESISQIVVWKEVYPTHFFKPKKDLIDSGFTERDGRWFLMVMALGHSVLGMIFETGWMPINLDDDAPVNPLLAQMARSVLEEMETSGITAELEHVLEMGTSPALVSADSVIIKSKSSRKLFSNKHQQENEQVKHALLHSSSSSKQDLTQKSLSNSTPSLIGNVGWTGNAFEDPNNQSMSAFARRMTSIDIDRQHLLSSGHYEGDSDADASLSPSDNTTPLLERRRGSERGSRMSTFCASDHDSQDGGMYRANHLKSQRKFASAYDLSNIRRSLEEVEDKNHMGIPQQLVSGSRNTMFHYVHFDKTEGVFLAPLETAGTSTFGALHSEVVQNFQKCIETIHATFQHGLMGKEISRNREISKFGFDRSLSCVQEQGVLFYCKYPQSTGKKAVELSYWVVGRLFLKPEPREFYVCFEDGAAQNMVELAFRLAFGTTI